MLSQLLVQESGRGRHKRDMAHSASCEFNTVAVQNAYDNLRERRFQPGGIHGSAVIQFGRMEPDRSRARVIFAQGSNRRAGPGRTERRQHCQGAGYQEVDAANASAANVRTPASYWPNGTGGHDFPHIASSPGPAARSSPMMMAPTMSHYRRCKFTCICRPICRFYVAGKSCTPTAVNVCFA